MIEYQVINPLIFQPKHMLWVLKRTVGMRRFFQASNYNLNLMSLKKQQHFFVVYNYNFYYHKFISLVIIELSVRCLNTGLEDRLI